MMAATTADNHPSLDEGIRVRLWEFIDLMEAKQKTESVEGE